MNARGIVSTIWLRFAVQSLPWVSPLDLYCQGTLADLIKLALKNSQGEGATFSKLVHYWNIGPTDATSCCLLPQQAWAIWTYQMCSRYYHPPSYSSRWLITHTHRHERAHTTTTVFCGTEFTKWTTQANLPWTNCARAFHPSRWRRRSSRHRWIQSPGAEPWLEPEEKKEHKSGTRSALSSSCMLFYLQCTHFSSIICVVICTCSGQTRSSCYSWWSWCKYDHAGDLSFNEQPDPPTDSLMPVCC